MNAESVKGNINLTNTDIQDLIKRISKIDNNITITSINKDKTAEENKTFYSVHYQANNNGKKKKKRLNIEIDTSEYNILNDYKIYFLIFFFIALTITISSLFPLSNIALVVLPVSISMAISFVKYYLPLIIQYYIDNITIEKRIAIDMKDEEQQLKEFLPEKFLSLLYQKNNTNIKNGKLKLEIENLDKIKFKNKIKKNIIATSFTILALCDVVLNPIALVYNLHYHYIPSYLEATKKINDKYKDQENKSEESENNIKTNTNTQILKNNLRKNRKRKITNSKGLIAKLIQKKTINDLKNTNINSI